MEGTRPVPSEQEFEGRPPQLLQALSQRARQGDVRTVVRRHASLPPEASYGIGADEFDELVVRQGGVCAICGRPDPEHLDHDHETGAVRGVLCFNCNGGLGQFRDSIDALRSAASYLEARGVELELLSLIRDRARELQDVSG
jgi:Recombination endonuclease VII